MWDKLVSMFLSIFQIWSKLSDETKENIINSIVSAFSDLFRQQYRDSKGTNGSAGGATA